MTFVASAPAPLTAMPALPPMPAASEAATDVALIDEDSVAMTLTAPLVVVIPSFALRIYACTSLLMLLRASETPMDSEIPASPPKDAASDAAPATATMVDASVAVKARLRPLMPAFGPVPSPDM